MQDTSSAAAAESSSYSYTPDAPISAMMPAALGPGQHDVRMARYQTLLSKLAALDDSGDEDNAFVLAKGKAKAKPRGRREAGGGAAVPVRVDSGGEPLVGNFSDAAAAMR